MINFIKNLLYRKNLFKKIMLYNSMTNIQELEGLTYTEYIKLKNALKILQNWDNIISKLPEKRRNKILENSKIYDPLIHLKKICKEKKDIIHTTYKFSKSLLTHGRLFACNSSLQGLPREIRNSLADGLYYDIDMVNAHPTLLSQYCIKNGIRCDILENYVKNRENILEEICKNNNICRDDAKNLFLSILNYTNKRIEFTNEIIEKFTNEMRLIHKQICSLNVDEYKKLKTRKGFNAEGSMINILLCNLEHNILMNAIDFLRNKSYNVDVLIFDGFMVRKEIDKYINDDVLKELNEYIFKKTSYNINFVEKSLNNKIDLEGYIEPLYDEPPEITYFKDKEKFEKTHLKIRHPAMYLSLLDDGTIDYQTEDKINGSYKQDSTTLADEDGNVFKTKFIKVWLNDEHIRVYDKMVFDPPPIISNKKYYNTWKNFDIEKRELPDNFDVNTNKYVLEYLDFISNLFNNNKEYINYYNAWSANMIQRPGERSSVCIVFYSYEEGVGKNMATKTLELCIGENYTYYISDVSNQLFGKHSSAELNKLLIVLNEVKGKDTYTNSECFRTRITDPKRDVELKQHTAFNMTNYCSYILNTNNLKSVNAGEKDRRFCIIPCINEKIDDKIYFNNYEKNINRNPEAIRCIYEYLKRFDIEKVVPNYLFGDDKVRPKSQIYKDLQDCNKPKEWDFLENLVIKYYKDPLITNKNEVKTSMEDIWSSYKSYCLNNNYDFTKVSSKSFHFTFTHKIIYQLDKKEETKEAITKSRKSLERYYIFDLEKLKLFFNLEG